MSHVIDWRLTSVGYNDSQGTLIRCFVLSQLEMRCIPGMGWVEAMDAANTLIFTRQSPRNFRVLAKNYPAPNANGAEGKILCVKALALRSN